MSDKKGKGPVPTASRRSPQEQNMWDMGYSKGKSTGVREGQDKVRMLVLNFLEERYMRPDVKRSTPKAEAILAVTADLAAMLKEHKI